jgi:hypothetical protein
VLLETGINGVVTGLDVKITPLTLLEDSRCPIDVQCIQAGTVRVRALLGSGLGEGVQTFTLGVPITTEAEAVELVEVKPAPHSERQIASSEYRFIFKVSKR